MFVFVSFFLCAFRRTVHFSDILDLKFITKMGFYERVSEVFMTKLYLVV